MEVVTREGFICLLSPLYMGQWLWDEGLNIMAAWRRAIELSLGDADTAKLGSIALSRTEKARHLEGDASLARRSAYWPLRVHLHSQAWVMAQPGRGFLLQARPFDPAPYSRILETGAQGAPHGRSRLLQRRSCRSHLDLQPRQGRLI